MPFDISCPSCQATYRVPDDKIGMSTRCKKCGEKFSLSIVTNPEGRLARDVSADDFLECVKAKDDPDVLSGKFGRYEIVKRLGQGGMGAVYLAKDTILGRLVALKVPLKRFAHHPEVAYRFAREARIGAEFRHPRFCPVYDIGRIDDRPFLSMAFIEGETLGDKLKRAPNRQLPEREAARIVREVALALAEAHRRNIIHRDLKPSNIMIDSSGEPIIMDFGLAKRADGSDESLTATGSPIGTPHYMSPEQVRGDKEAIGAASDVYSLGVILYESLTGRPPFQGVMSHVFVQIAAAPPESPSNLRLSMTRSLEVACLKAMAKEPKDRYHSMESFAAALRLEPKRREEPIRVEVQVHSRTWIIWTTIVAALVLFGVWLNRPERPPEGDPPPRVASIGPVSDEEELIRAVERELPKSDPDKPATFVPTKSLDVAKDPEPNRDPPKLVDAPPPSKTEAPKSQPEKKGVPVAAEHAPPERVVPSPAAKTDSPKPLDVTTNAIGMKLVLIPAGSFEMGSDDSDKDAQEDEKKAGKKHRVRITRPFWLGQTEVTVGQFRKFAETGYKTEAERDGKGGWGFDEVKGKFTQDPKYAWRNPGFEQTDDHPVVNVSWNDAIALCDWLSKGEGLKPFHAIAGGEVTVADWTGSGYRLPTEAEWEYACRAGTNTRYSMGHVPKLLSRAANLADKDLKSKIPRYPFTILDVNDGFPFTSPVGRYAANDFKLYDMHGNVWEWCWDWYSADYYKESPADDPRGPSRARARVGRGGSWYDTAELGRSANRDRDTPGFRDIFLGVRVARGRSEP